MGLSAERKKEIIETWKKFQVSYLEVEFYCGGDSMGDVTPSFYDSDGKIIEEEELEAIYYCPDNDKQGLESEMYNKVSFYEVSDGFYQGESGIVRIELEGENFTYAKEAESEFDDNRNIETEIILNDEETELVNKYIQGFNFVEEEIESKNIIYKNDIILTPSLKQSLDNLFIKISKEIKSKITDLIVELEQEIIMDNPKNFVHDYQEYSEINFVNIKENILTVTVNLRYSYYTPSTF